jgi:hypothetical protein
MGRRPYIAGLALAALLAGGSGRAGSEAPEDGAQTAAEVAALRRQVQYLARALAECRAEADALQARFARRAFDAEGGADADPDALARALAAGVRIIDVNAELRMVALDAGRRQGLTPGMTFSVLRGDRVLGRVRVVDVRREIAGAVIETMKFGSAPQKDDRVLMANARE